MSSKSSNVPFLFNPFWQRGIKRLGSPIDVLDGFPKGVPVGCIKAADLHSAKQESLLSVQHQQQEPPPPTGLVVTLLLGRNPVLEGAICGKYFASQLKHFIQPHEMDILLVVATPNYGRNNGDAIDATTSSTSHLQQLRQCLSLMTATTAASNARRWINLDGSSLTTFEYRLPGSTMASETMRPTRLFLAESDIWPNQQTSTSSMSFDPPACKAPLDYILGTRWYIDDMLHLAILQEYDYFIKLDPDVLFFKPLPYNLLHDMKLRGALFAHTAEYPPHGRSGSAQCAKDIVSAVQKFSQQVASSSSSSSSQAPPTNGDLGWNGVPCTTSPQTVFRNADRYYTNFILGRTNFFQSKRVRALGKFIAHYPNGFFRHRWTDQIFWSMALGLFVTDYDDNNNNKNIQSANGVVADYTEFRCAPLQHCWLSSHDAKTFPDASNRCDNHGYFLHTKHISRWETLLAGDMMNVPGEDYLTFKHAQEKAQRHRLPSRS